MSPVDWTNMNGIMDKAYKVCSYVRGYVPPICRVWAPLISGGYIKFRMKYGTNPIYYAELTYKQILAISTDAAAAMVTRQFMKQMLERIENND